MEVGEMVLKRSVDFEAKIELKIGWKFDRELR